MDPDPNPYQSPEEPTASDRPVAQLSTAALVIVFFLPSACYSILYFAASFLHKEQWVNIILLTTVISGIFVSLFSAYIYTVREKAGPGTLALMTFVYLLAQILALMILQFGFHIILGL